eukprot:1821203-Pyramimonas_sp.AAC.1
MLSAYAKAGRWRAALELYGEMEDARVKMDTIAYSALICVLAKGDQLRRALEVYAHMRAEKVNVDRIVYSDLLRTCAKVRVESGNRTIMSRERRRPRGHVGRKTATARSCQERDGDRTI